MKKVERIEQLLDAPSILRLFAAGEFLGAVDLVRRTFDDANRRPVWAHSEKLSDAFPGFEDIDWASVGMAVSPADSLFNLAVGVWRLDGQENIAIEILRMADDQGSQDARPVLADYLLWLKRFREAEEVVQTFSPEIISGAPRLAGVVGALRFEYRHSTEIETVKLLLNSLSESEDFKLVLADLYLKRGEWTKARDTLSELVEAGNSEAPIKMGNLLRDHFVDTRAAEGAFRQGVEMGDAFSAYNLGMMLIKMKGRSDEAREWIQYAADRGDATAVARLRKLNGSRKIGGGSG